LAASSKGQAFGNGATVLRNVSGIVVKLWSEDLKVNAVREREAFGLAWATAFGRCGSMDLLPGSGPEAHRYLSLGISPASPLPPISGRREFALLVQRVQHFLDRNLGDELVKIPLALAFRRSFHLK
jgi:hypothetical protein